MANLPGIDELMQWLEGLDKQTGQEVQRQSSPGGLGRAPTYVEQKIIPPSPPARMMGGQPLPSPATLSPMSVGAGPQSILGALGRGVGKVAGPIGMGLALQPAFTKAGEVIGDSYRDSLIQPEDYGRQPMGGAGGKWEDAPVSQPAQVAVQQTKAPINIGYLPDELSDQYGPIDQSKQAAQPVARQEEYPEGNWSVPLADLGPKEEADQFMKQVLQSQTQALGPVQEEPDQESTQTVSELTKPRAVEQEPTKQQKFGRALEKFAVTADTGDSSLAERRRLELQDTRRKFTPQEALRGELAKNDIEGTRSFNRLAQLKQQDTGGLTDREKMNTSIAASRENREAARRAELEKLGKEHGYKLEEIGASGASQRYTPEMQKQITQGAVMQHNLGAFSPQQIKESLGLDISPEGLQFLRDAALKNDPMAMMVTEMLRDRMANMKGASAAKGAKSSNITTKALSGSK